MEQKNYMITHTAPGIVQLTIDAGALNILTSKVLDALTQEILTLSEVPDLRCIVLDGGGKKSFIGGANIKEMVALNHDQASVFITKLFDLCESIRHCPVPVIAKIEGVCFGAGVELIAACDIRIAATTASFAMPEVKLGIPSVIHAALLPNLIGAGNTRWWLLTGEVIDANQAQTWGLVTHVVLQTELAAQVEATIAALMACQPLALRAQKKLLNEWETVALPQVLKTSIQYFADAYLTKEPTISMTKFLNKS